MVRKRKSLVTAAKVCLSIPIGRCSPISSSMPSVQEEKRFSGRILIPSPLHFSSRNLANGWQRQDVRENTYADECIRISSIRRRNPVRLERRMKGIRNEDCRSTLKRPWARLLAREEECYHEGPRCGLRQAFIMHSLSLCLPP